MGKTEYARPLPWLGPHTEGDRRLLKGDDSSHSMERWTEVVPGKERHGRSSQLHVS